MNVRHGLGGDGRRARTLLSAVVSICLVAGVNGVGAADIPPGIPVGPWILTPALELGYAWDSNVFYTPAIAGPVSSTVLTAAPTLVATLPFRNSLFRMDYQAVKMKYGTETISLARDLAQDLGAELALKFSTLDRLRLDARATQGVAFAQVGFDPGGSAVFHGDPYDLWTQTVEAAREEYGHRGYVVRLTHESLSFPPGTTVSYFEYTGYTAFAEYKEPLSSRFWLVGSYEGRRYDNFLANQTSSSGVPYRREHSDLLWAGYQGLLGPNEPLVIRGGWADFRFPGGTGSGFRGFVLDAGLQVHVGASTRLDLTATRRPWPAYFLDDNYYLSETVLARLERVWLRYSSAGLEASVARYLYEPLPFAGGNLPAGFVRKDTGLRMQVYANLFVSDRFGFRMSIARDNRDSNYDGGPYSKTVYLAGMILGWRADVH